MASPGLLLLLMSSSLLLSIMSVSASPDQNQLMEVTQKLNKVKEGAAKFIHDHPDEIRTAVTPFLEMIPVAGPLIIAISKVGLGIINNNLKGNEILDALKEEFQSLNSKLDKYHVEQKWDTWAAGAYHKPEIKINVAWDMSKKILLSLVQARNSDEMERLKKKIITICSESEAATMTLHYYLTSEPRTFTNNLAKELADHVRCHEKDLREYTVFISKLIYKGNTLNRLCYKLEQIESKELVNGDADIAYNATSAMFQIHKNCILNSLDYIKPEVEELITDTKDRQQLAHKVRSFLVQNYDRYDWMVVAFISQRSKHKIIKILNSHVLTGFTEVTKGKVSVGVARQVKGTHTKADEVIKTIKSCLTESVWCYEVAVKLRECSKTVDGVPVSETYTAVHAFIFEGHDSIPVSDTNTAAQALSREAEDSQDVEEAEDVGSADPQDTSIPHIYTGKCKRYPDIAGKVLHTLKISVKVGKFVVMIKSDEELGTKDPCSKLKCGEGERGKCVPVEGAFVAMCECNPPYYGQNCEESLDDYKKSLESSMEQVLQPGVPERPPRQPAVPERPPRQPAVPERPPRQPAASNIK